MDTTELETDDPLPSVVDRRALTRRGFLRGAAVTGGGLVAAGIVVACSPAGQPGWTFLPGKAPASGGVTPSALPSATAAATAAASTIAASPSASGGSIPTGWTQHDVDARQVIRRYIGNLAPALQGIYGDTVFTKLADILGAADGYPELSQKPAFVQVPQLVLNDVLQPLKPTLDGSTKVFNLTIDEIEQHIDEKLPPVAALGYNKQWPVPRSGSRRATGCARSSPTT